MRTYSECAACGELVEVWETGVEEHAFCPEPDVAGQPVIEVEVDEDGANRFVAEAVAGSVGKSSSSSPLSLGEAAVRYASFGWPVFPLRIGDKRPWPGSRGFKDATADVDVIRRWWDKQPRSNIGLATGHLFDAIDVDYKHGAGEWWPGVREVLTLACHGEVRTWSGGLHVFVLPDGGGNKTEMFKVPGLDYRGLGGYVVAAPSVVKGVEYAWTVRPSPAIKA